MKKIILCGFTVVMVSSIGISQIQLHLFSEITNANKAYSKSYIQETNLKLELHPNAKMPAIEKSLSSNPWQIGFLLDVTIPQYDTHSNLNTGYSVHAAAGYLISNTFLLALRIGYIKFGSDIIEDSYRTIEQEQTNIPLSVGGNYVFETRRAIRPYIGLSLGLIMQKSYLKITYDNDYDNNEYSSTANSFGFITELGLYYSVASTTMIQLSVSHSIVFNEVNIDGYLSILAGVIFTLGGN